jgi:hypothetical protein
VSVSSLRALRGAAIVALFFASFQISAQSAYQTVSVHQNAADAIRACQAIVPTATDANGYCSYGQLSYNYVTIGNHLYQYFVDGHRKYWKINAGYTGCNSYGICNVVATDECNIDFWDVDGKYCGPNAYGIQGENTNVYGENAQGEVPPWTDDQGYDQQGFDSDGLDRAGNSAANGGGYSGSTGTGGSMSPTSFPPQPDDPQNGNNSNSDGLQCFFAYPLAVSKVLLPGQVLDGLNMCANGCAYQKHSTYIDFSANEEVVEFTATGYACNGEASAPTAPIKQRIPDAAGPNQPLYTDLNSCYASGGYYYCNALSDSGDARCFIQDGNIIGPEISCGSLAADDLRGSYNGIYQPIDPEIGCGSFGGSIQCVDINGDPISQSSPDHVINGGNTDGNPDNDVFTNEQDVFDNGQNTAALVSQTLDARSLAREIDSVLRDDFAELGEAIGNIDLDINASSFEESVQMFDAQSALDGIEDGMMGAIGSVGTDAAYTFDGGSFMDFSNPLNSLFPQPSGCEVFHYSIVPDRNVGFNIDTCQLAPFKTVAAWFLYGLTFWTMLGIALRNNTESV